MANSSNKQPRRQKEPKSTVKKGSNRVMRGPTRSGVSQSRRGGIPQQLSRSLGIFVIPTYHQSHRRDYPIGREANKHSTKLLTGRLPPRKARTSEGKYDELTSTSRRNKAATKKKTRNPKG